MDNYFLLCGDSISTIKSQRPLRPDPIWIGYVANKLFINEE